MQGNHTQSPLTPARLTASKLGVLTLSGYGLSLTVDRGHLVAKDGVCDERREGRFSRAHSRLKRVIILGHTGYLSLEALRWLHDVGASLAQLDGTGAVILTSGPLGTDYPHLRRAQAMAPWTGVGVAIARDLLRSKLDGQGGVIRGHDSDAAERIERLAGELKEGRTVDDLRLIESQAAGLYWQALAAVPVQFARRDAGKVPEHWKSLGSRMSPLTGSPRLAATPGQAIVNYLYAILEVEARVACLAVGLDPGLGVLHADLRARDSLACDVMEAVRPDVDRWALTLLERRVFTARDFFETRQGQCRVMPALARELAETGPQWARAVAPVAEQVARVLLESRIPFPTDAAGKGMGRSHGSGQRGSNATIATPLTGRNQSAGRPSNDGVAREPRAPTVKLARTCKQCGGTLTSKDQTVCPACHAVYMREVALPTWLQSGPAKLAQLRAEGRDPARTRTALKKLGATQRERFAARQAWDREHAGEVADDTAFQRDILPRLQTVSLSAMMRATGLSLRYCADIRNGEKVPHPMYWQRLARLEASSRNG